MNMYKCPECGAELQTGDKMDGHGGCMWFEYECPECGKRYDETYEFQGLWDVENEEYATDSGLTRVDTQKIQKVYALEQIGHFLRIVREGNKYRIDGAPMSSGLPSALKEEFALIGYMGNNVPRFD